MNLPLYLFSPYPQKAYFISSILMLVVAAGILWYLDPQSLSIHDSKAGSCR
jgi:hypothetical protein